MSFRHQLEKKENKIHLPSSKYLHPDHPDHRVSKCKQINSHIKETIKTLKNKLKSNQPTHPPLLTSCKSRLNLNSCFLKYKTSWIIAFRVDRVMLRSSAVTAQSPPHPLPTTVTAPCKGLGVFVKLDDRLGRGICSTVLGLSKPLGSPLWTRDRFNSLVPRAAGRFDCDLERGKWEFSVRKRGQEETPGNLSPPGVLRRT